MTEKRGRGRPKDSGKEDGPFLADMADLMIRTPIRRVMAARSDWEAASPEAMRNRLQEKWKVVGEAELAAAHKRAAARTATPRSSHLNYVGIPDGHLGAFSLLASPAFDQAVASSKGLRCRPGRHRKIRRGVAGHAGGPCKIRSPF